MHIQSLNQDVSSVHVAALLLGFAGLLSRFLGVLRDRLLAAEFGAGRELDVYYTAFQIPDFLSVLFLLGAGSAAIVPIFQEYLKRNEDDALRLISRLHTLFLIGSAICAGVAFFAAPFIVRFLAPGFSSQEQALTMMLSRIIVLSPILLGLSSILSAVGQSFQRFFAYAIAPIFYNLGLIIGVVFLAPKFGVLGLGVGVVVGALMHFLVQFFSVHHLGFVPRFDLDIREEGVRKVVQLSFPRVLSVSLSRITVFALIALGSTLAAGSISVFGLAQNLYFLPIGVFGLSYATAVFPRLSKAYLDRNADEFFAELFLGMRSILFWVAPSVTLFIVLRAHVVRVALGSGAFSWEDTKLTAATLAILAIAIIPESFITLLIRGFYALENTWMPFVINAGASILAIGLAFCFTRVIEQDSIIWQLLTRFLRVEDLPNPQVLGLALGFSIGLLFNGLFLYIALLRLGRRTFSSKAQAPVAACAKILFAAVACGIAAYLVRVSFSETFPLITFMGVLTQGLLAGTVGGATYLGLLMAMQSEDVTGLQQSFKHRLFKIRILPKSWNGDHLQ